MNDGLGDVGASDAAPNIRPFWDEWLIEKWYFNWKVNIKSEYS